MRHGRTPAAAAAWEQYRRERGLDAGELPRGTFEIAGGGREAQEDLERAPRVPSSLVGLEERMHIIAAGRARDRRADELREREGRAAGLRFELELAELETGPRALEKLSRAKEAWLEARHELIAHEYSEFPVSRSPETLTLATTTAPIYLFDGDPAWNDAEPDGWCELTRRGDEGIFATAVRWTRDAAGRLFRARNPWKIVLDVDDDASEARVELYPAEATP